ncbi:MAG: SIMPL domain-containing protein [Acidimicrobiales bacterium]
MSRIRTVCSVGLAGLALVAVGCSGQSTGKAPVVNVTNDPSGSQHGIVVSGTGKVSGVPDTVSVSIGVSVKRPTAPAAINDAATSATKLIDALKAAGVAEKDVQTTNYSINQEFRYPDSGPVADGFRVSNQVIAKVRAVDKVGAVIDAATAAGGSDAVVSGVSFRLDDDEAALAGARDKAFADARKKAEQFAKLSGRKLGQVVSISQTDTTTPPVSTPLAYAAQADRAATPIQAGEVQTAVTVEVRWTFAD